MEHLPFDVNYAVHDVAAIAELLGRADLCDETPEYIHRLGDLIHRRLRVIKDFLSEHYETDF